MTMKTRQLETWDAAKAVLRGKFVVIQSYLKKRQTSNRQPNFTPKKLEKEQKNPKISRKEILKI